MCWALYRVPLASESKTKEHASEGTSSVLEPKVELSHDGKIREIAMDSADSDLKKDDANELLVALKAEKEELEAALNREQAVWRAKALHTRLNAIAV
uniref:Uncharacterized protein n=1 Tax=Oryza glumipatula TaxID=40148 RepID=A0A0D9YKA1_9ORYZ